MDVIYDSAQMRISTNGVENFYWPLTRKEQEVSRDALLAGIVSAARARGDELDDERDLLATMLQLLAREGLVLLLTYTVGHRAKNAGHSVEWPYQCDYCHAVGNGIAPSLSDSTSFNALIKGPVCHPKWRRYPVKLRRDVWFNGWGYSALKFASPKRDIYACHATDVLEEHARVVSEPVKYTLFGEWFTPLDLDSEEVINSKPIALAVENDVVDAVSQAFKSIGEDLPTSFEEYVRQFVQQGSKLLRVHLERILAKPHKIPKRLWTGTGGYIWARILRHAVRRMGGEVTGHEHGTGESIITYFNTKTFSDLESADRFVTFNTNQRNWLDKTVDERFLVPLQRPELLVPRYAATLNRYAGRPLLGKRKSRDANAPLKVMYVGPIYVGFSPRVSNHNSDILLIDWQARLFAKMREWGYEVIFKPHPEGNQRPPKIFAEEFGVKELSEPFENVWNQADVYLFDWKSTTALSTAMSTGLPVALVDFSFEKFAPDMQKLVEHNCGLVNGWADDFNRLQVNWDELKQALECPPVGDSATVRETAFKFA